jgi:hypothetical protein
MPPFNNQAPKPTPKENLAYQQSIVAQGKALAEERLRKERLAKEEQERHERIIAGRPDLQEPEPPEVRHIGNGVFEQIRRENE